MLTNSIRPIRSGHTRQHTALLAAIGAVCMVMAAQGQAQTIYRVMGADGKVTFSDKLPPTNANATATGKGGMKVGTIGAGGGGPALPFELNQIAGRFPVTLYSGPGCAPCDNGRSQLTSRGIPFTEKTVSTAEDSDALRRISSDTSLPFLTIGGQQIRGYSDTEWDQYLNAAGYPKSSALPPGYRNPPATPLVVVQKQTPAVAKPEEKPARLAPAVPNRTPVDNTSNPTGIKF